MKTVKINKIKVNIFEKQELKEKLKMNQKDIDLVIEYQRIFPELLQDDTGGFVINTQTLWEQLNKPQGTYRKFKTRNIIDYFEKDVEYNEIWMKDKVKVSEDKLDRGLDISNLKQMNGNGYTNVIYVTLDVAKQICMTVGVTRNTNEITRNLPTLCRKYFITMEKTLRNYKDWNKVRESVKLHVNIMKSSIAKWLIKNKQTAPNMNQYCLEFDGINKLLTGYKAKELQNHLGYKDKETREHLEGEINNALDFLQKLNISMLDNNLSYLQRMRMIEMMCTSQYIHIKFLL